MLPRPAVRPAQQPGCSPPERVQSRPIAGPAHTYAIHGRTGWKPVKVRRPAKPAGSWTTAVKVGLAVSRAGPLQRRSAEHHETVPMPAYFQQFCPAQVSASATLPVLKDEYKEVLAWEFSSSTTMKTRSSDSGFWTIKER